jgi:hypothetical protein
VVFWHALEAKEIAAREVESIFFAVAAGSLFLPPFRVSFFVLWKEMLKDRLCMVTFPLEIL